jgi:putative ATP-dependent endonuclease of the OLD family
LIIDSVRVQNFRSILDETLKCDKLTVLVGANGAGKSSFLKAIALFYDAAPRVERDDFYDCDTTRDIVISTTFRDLSEEESGRFSNYVQDGKLIVDRVFKWDAGKSSSKLHGSTLQNPEFADFRVSAKLGARPAKVEYDELRALERYSQFPQWSSLTAAHEIIERWESENPQLCSRSRDDGQFFGFTQVGQGYLGKSTVLRYIQAVRDASTDSTDKGDTTINEIMELVVRSSIASRDDIRNFREQTNQSYSELLNPANLSELRGLSDSISQTLRVYVPDSRVELSWQPTAELEIELPMAEVKLVEDGYVSTVGRTGHGLQRAFIMTLLQILADAQRRVVDGQTGGTLGRLPHLLLMIEEPELYQHPDRQRHLANVLKRLSEGESPGVATTTQVIYSTHSPHFVNIERFDKVRLLRKKASEVGRPKVTRVSVADPQIVATELSQLYGTHATNFSLEAVAWRLQTIMTPWMNEGFFARAVILVEGEQDRAAILEVASLMGHELESMGLSVIPCFGKPNLDRPTIIFRSLGIPIYAVWDNDRGTPSEANVNRRLLRLFGYAEEDYPCRVEADFACIEGELESSIKRDIGEDLYNELNSQCLVRFDVDRARRAEKNPIILREIIKQASNLGKRCTEIEQIVSRIVAKASSG